MTTIVPFIVGSVVIIFTILIISFILALLWIGISNWFIKRRIPDDIKRKVAERRDLNNAIQKEEEARRSTKGVTTPSQITDDKTRTSYARTGREGYGGENHLHESIDGRSELQSFSNSTGHSKKFRLHKP